MFFMLLFKEWITRRQEWKAGWLARILSHEFNQKIIWQTRVLTVETEKSEPIGHISSRQSWNILQMSCLWGVRKREEMRIMPKFEAWAFEWIIGCNVDTCGQKRFQWRKKTLLWYALMTPSQCQEKDNAKGFHFRSNHVKFSFLWPNSVMIFRF